MPPKKEPSRYDLRGFTFNGDEPDWLRLVLWISLLLFYLALAHMLGKFALPAISAAWIPRLSWLKDLFKGSGRSP
jgi:hypothetical protein